MFLNIYFISETHGRVVIGGVAKENDERIGYIVGVHLHDSSRNGCMRSTDFQAL